MKFAFRLPKDNSYLCNRVSDFCYAKNCDSKKITRLQIVSYLLTDFRKHLPFSEYS